MRFAPIAASALILATVTYAGPPVGPIGQPAEKDGPLRTKAGIESPVGQLALAIGDLAQNVSPIDAPFMRYLSFATVPDDPIIAKLLEFPEDRATFHRTFRFWFNHVSAAKSILKGVPVDGPTGTFLRTNGSPTLLRYDTRDAPNWTRAAWVLVADRDYLFREKPLGLLPNRETTFGRIITGIQVNEKTLSAGFILSAYQLFRDGLDTGRSSTYYDLLYGHRRHPDADRGLPTFQAIPRGPDATEPKPPIPQPWVDDKPWPLDGKRYPSGSFTWVKQSEHDAYEKAHAAWVLSQSAGPAKPAVDAIPTKFVSINDANRGDKNFPATGKDFEIEWDAFVDNKDIGKKFLVDPRIGGIAPGADSDAKIGSIVAGQDRAIAILQTRFGWAARTHDVFKNIGDKDHIERFREIALGDAKADAHELLATIPNGTQAALLSDADDKRLEVAVTAIARILTRDIDPRFVDVRTMMGCTACHMPQNGFIPFTDAFRANAEAGIKFNVDNSKPGEAAAVRDFYLSWSKKVKTWKDPMKDYIESTTETATDKAWTGIQTWKYLHTARDWYDRPVTIEVVAFEFGMTVEDLRARLLTKSEKTGPIQARLNQLAIGRVVPRQTYQDEIAGKIALWLDATGTPDAGERIKAVLSPQLIESAYQKFGYTEKGGKK